MLYRCPYCNWSRIAPNYAEFQTEEDYNDAMAEFLEDQEHHDCHQSSESQEEILEVGGFLYSAKHPMM